MLLLMCYGYDQYSIILIISFVITIHQLVATLIVRYSVERSKAGVKEKNADGLSLPYQNTPEINISLV